MAGDDLDATVPGPEREEFLAFLERSRHELGDPETVRSLRRAALFDLSMRGVEAPTPAEQAAVVKALWVFGKLRQWNEARAVARSL